MKGRVLRLGFIACVVWSLWGAVAGAADSAATLAYYKQGGPLPGAPAYEWDYGCSPTAAGMMMGYYDIHGYGGLSYSNLVPGGVAEPSTWPIPPSQSPLVDAIIASPGYITAFYSGDFNNRGNDQFYGKNGDDIPGRTHAQFNSLGDFMGTSQDSVHNANGWTTFYYWTNGAKFTGQDAVNQAVQGKDGMYGIWEYVKYAGYTDDLTNFYTQLIFSTAAPDGFTFADYENVINGGGVVMIQVEGHSMFGFGYDPNGVIYLHDTWDGLDHSMTWGGSYDSMAMWGVTVFTPAGGTLSVPEPATLLLLGSGLAGLAGLAWRRHRE